MPINRRVGGSTPAWGCIRAMGAGRAVIDNGSAFAPDDLAANYHRVGKELAHPTGQRRLLNGWHWPATFLIARERQELGA